MSLSRSPLALGVLLACACRSANSPGSPASPGAAPDVQYYALSGALGQQRLPFSSAVRIGSLIYLSGQTGTDSTGRLVPGGIETETRQTLENIRALLGRVGSSMDRVVKCTAMLADMAEWERMNRVYITYFTRNLPARSAFGTSGLARGARIELECIATR
ncbi:MAG: RidA family protein [Gemmatimonadaceae bacterium]